MRPDPLRAVELSVVDVTPKTRWIFIEVETEAGFRGTGEATLTGQEEAVADALDRFAPRALALPDADPSRLHAVSLPSLPAAAAFSALDQALWDASARRRGVAVAAALGGGRRSAVPVYANVNRRTLDRSPAGFAASARAALEAGHLWIKIAPFDEATAEARAAGGLAAAVEPGLGRIAAVRDAMGPGGRLMVDCHWRLDEAAAHRLIAAAAGLGVHWVECPLPETSESIEALARLRAGANRRGVLLAGLETAVSLAGVLPFVRAGAYDVVMPDVKYAGGLGEVMRIAEALRRGDVAFSPHNPTGPVCHAASLQACAAAGALHSLEVQFDETPLFAELVGVDLARASDGAMPLPPGPGIGAALRPAALAPRLSIHRRHARD